MHSCLMPVKLDIRHRLTDLLNYPVLAEHLQHKLCHPVSHFASFQEQVSSLTLTRSFVAQAMLPQNKYRIVSIPDEIIKKNCKETGLADVHLIHLARDRAQWRLVCTR
jgi:hypothetical protein